MATKNTHRNDGTDEVIKMVKYLKRTKERPTIKCAKCGADLDLIKSGDETLAGFYSNVYDEDKDSIVKFASIVQHKCPQCGLVWLDADCIKNVVKPPRKARKATKEAAQQV